MTPFIKKKDIKKDWYIINAENAVVGRLAAYISKVLRGKNKPTFNQTPGRIYELGNSGTIPQNPNNPNRQNDIMKENMWLFGGIKQ